MKKLILLAAVALLYVCFTACTNSNSPEGVTKAYLSALQKGNYEKALRLYFNKGEKFDPQQEQETLQMFEDKMKKSVEDKGGIASYEVQAAEISEDGNSAVVRYTIHYGDGTSADSKNKTIKVDGKWYLDPKK